jgi:hypothetical protein
VDDDRILALFLALGRVPAGGVVLGPDLKVSLLPGQLANDTLMARERQRLPRPARAPDVCGAYDQEYEQSHRSHGSDPGDVVV